MNKQKIDISKIKKVFSFGCSFSDYMFGTDIVYGEKLAELLNAEYYHHGIGCGSNQRIWRRFFDYAQKETFDETTLVTVQWTEMIRTELFWATPIDKNIPLQKHQDWFDEKGSADSVPHQDGVLFKFKHDSWTWHQEWPDVADHMKNISENCLSTKWSHELWSCYDFNIREYCKRHNIPLVLIGNKNYQNNEKGQFLNDNFFNIVHVDKIAREHPRKMLNLTQDYAHMSTEGHIKFAKKILNKLEL